VRLTLSTCNYRENADMQGHIINTSTAEMTKSKKKEKALTQSAQKAQSDSQTTASYDAPTTIAARNKVFATPEFLELIFLNLPMDFLLVTVQRQILAQPHSLVRSPPTPPLLQAHPLYALPHGPAPPPTPIAPSTPPVQALLPILPVRLNPRPPLPARQRPPPPHRAHAQRHCLLRLQGPTL